jgi:hypothetical protein
MIEKKSNDGRRVSALVGVDLGSDGESKNDDVARTGDRRGAAV